MRIVKKERIDVKKFMEDMKANKTKRTFTSVEERAPRPNERVSQEKNPIQYDNFSNHSIPVYGRPTSLRNQGFYDSNNYNIFHQFDLMSQNSQTYRPNYAPPPPNLGNNAMNVHPSPPAMYFNQMNPYFGGSQFPTSQYMYPNFNNSNQLSNYDYSKRASYANQPQPQPMVIEQVQQFNKSNSKVKIAGDNNEVSQEKGGKNEIMRTDEKLGQEIKQMMDIETKKKSTKPIEFEIGAKLAHKEQKPQEISQQQKKRAEKSKEDQQAVTPKDQSQPKKRRYRKKEVQNLKVAKNTQVDEKQDLSRIETEVNKSFQEMLERDRKEKQERQALCKSILTLVDSKLIEEFRHTKWSQLTKQLQRAAAKAEKIKLGCSSRLCEQVSDALYWLQDLSPQFNSKR